MIVQRNNHQYEGEGFTHTIPTTAADTPSRAHDGKYDSSARSVIYASTIFVVGVGKRMVESGLQYFCNTCEALCWSSVAELPQLLLMSMEIDETTLLDKAVLEQKQD